MNIITISSPNKTKVIKRKGTPKESLGYIIGYLTALEDNNTDISKIHISHKYINSNNVKRIIPWKDYIATT